MKLTKDAIIIDIGKATEFSGGTEKVQASVMTGNGTSFSQTWNVSIDSRTFKFSSMTADRLALLLDFHLNVVDGLADAFTLEEDDGTSYICKFMDKKINFAYVEKVIFEGIAETEVYNVSFSIRKE